MSPTQDEQEATALIILREVDPPSARVVEDAFTKAKDLTVLRSVAHEMVEVTTKASMSLMEMAQAMQASTQFRMKVLEALVHGTQTKGGLLALAMVLGMITILSGFGAEIIDLVELLLRAAGYAPPTPAPPG